MKSRLNYLLLMHLVILMWGFTGILGKLILLDAVVIVWFRVLIAFIALGLYMFFTKTSFRVSSKKHLLYIAIIGLFVGIHWLTFYKSIQLSTASLGILCLSTTTLHVSWLEPIVMKKSFSWLEFILSVIVVFGIYITTDDFSKNEYIALAYGLVSALFAALFAVFNTKLAEKDTSSVISLYEMLSSCIAITLFLYIQGNLNFDLFVMSKMDFYLLLFLGIACTSFAFLATITIMKKLGTFTVSLSINLEPIYTLIFAIILLNENDLLSIRFYIGALIIILTVLANGIIKGVLQREKGKRIS